NTGEVRKVPAYVNECFDRYVESRFSKHKEPQFVQFNYYAFAVNTELGIFFLDVGLYQLPAFHELRFNTALRFAAFPSKLDFNKIRAMDSAAAIKLINHELVRERNTLES